MATPTKDPRFKYTLVTPDGRKYVRGGTAAGVVQSRRWLIDTLLHGLPIGCKIEDMRAVGPQDQEIPVKEQPAFFTEDIEPRAEPVDKLRHAFHPGVEQARPEGMGPAPIDNEIKTAQTPHGLKTIEQGDIPKMPPNPDVATKTDRAAKTDGVWAEGTAKVDE